MTDLLITVDDRTLTAEWLDGHPGTRDAIADALPLEGEANRWGDELYFGVDIVSSPRDTRRKVPRGSVAYWPDGPAVCVFWGPTPASTSDTPTAASPVAPIAHVDDTSPLESLKGSARMRIEPI